MRHLLGLLFVSLLDGVENHDAATTEIAVTDMLASSTTGKENADTTTTETVDTEKMLSSKSAYFKSYASSSVLTTSEDQTTIFASSSSTGLFKPVNITDIIILLVLFVTVVIIVFVAILGIRKSKNSGQNEESQNEEYSLEYETMVPDKKLSDDIVPIYTELELTQHPMPSNNSIYANVKPTREAVDMDISDVDPHTV